jgi:hypothetical protein
VADRKICVTFLKVKVKTSTPNYFYIRQIKLFIVVHRQEEKLNLALKRLPNKSGLNNILASVGSFSENDEFDKTPRNMSCHIPTIKMTI